MSGLESIIVYTAGALLLAITASRFLIQESIALVRLFKELVAEVRQPLPPSQQLRALPDSHSKGESVRVPRSNAG